MTDARLVAFLRRHVEDEFEARARRDGDAAAHRLESLAGLAVDRHHERLHAVEGEDHDARIGEIGEAQPHARIGREFQRRRRGLAVDGQQRADAPGALRFLRIVEAALDFPLRVEPPVVEDEEKVVVGGQRLRLVDDEQALEAPAHQLRRLSVNAGAVAEEARLRERRR